MAGMKNGNKPHNVGEFKGVHSAYPLNGKNYPKWFPLIRTIFNGKGKASHLTL